MNRLLKIVAGLLVASCCVGAAFADDVQDELDSLVEKWTVALVNEDINGFLDCYWDDAVRIVYFPGQDAEITEGIAELRTSQSASFQQLDFRTMNLIYDDPVRYFPEVGLPAYVYPNSRFSYMDVFEFEERQGQYRIVRQYLMPHPAAE
jgi:hypothetical protein